MTVLAAAVARLWFPMDIEYKYDEHYMFERSQAIGVTEPWPAVGMNSGSGLRNPALSVWTFVGVAKLFGATDPVGLAQGVQWLNVLAFVILAVALWRRRGDPALEIWLWGLAFAAVNPIGVVLARKIWAQSTLPLFCILFWLSYLRLHRAGGAFFFALLGLGLGQIHMSGFFFYASALVVVAVNGEWKKIVTHRAALGGFVAGTLLATLPLVPWIAYVLGSRGGETIPPRWFESLIYARFPLNWILGGLGLNIRYSIASRGEQAFRTWSVWGWSGVASVVTGLLLTVHVLDRVRRKNLGLANLTSELGRLIRTGFLVSFVGLGLCLTPLPFNLPFHYLIVAFPFLSLTLPLLAVGGSTEARARKRGRRLLTLHLVTQLALTAALFFFLHASHGVEHADYGVAYGSQPISKRLSPGDR